MSGLLAGLAGAQYATGKDLSYLKGQLHELIKIEGRVATNEARLDGHDFEISEIADTWRNP